MPTASAAIAAAMPKKRDLAKRVVALGLPLTVNWVVHRQNIHNLARMIDLAVEMGAKRVEIAHTQYYGWAFKNRRALMPTYRQTLDAIALVEDARRRLEG